MIRAQTKEMPQLVAASEAGDTAHDGSPLGREHAAHRLNQLVAIAFVRPTPAGVARGVGEGAGEVRARWRALVGVLGERAR